MNDPSSSNAPRRRWTPQEKASAVRRYLRGGVSLETLAAEIDATPGQISDWCRRALDSLDLVFERPPPSSQGSALAAREVRIHELENIVHELSTELVRLKKNGGER